jgi:small-conductance mechanosensitive channel
MKFKTLFSMRYISHKNLIIFIIFTFLSMTENLSAIEPDTMLYSERVEQRKARYQVKAQQLEDQLAAAVDDREKQNLQVQQQLLIKLQELSNTPDKPSMDLAFSVKDLQNPPSWQDVEQYIERYISIINEGKISAQNLENTAKQMQTLYNRLIALAEKSPEQDLLQLQYAYQVRKSAIQTEIDKQLKEGLAIAKKEFPTILEQIYIDQQTISEQSILLRQAKNQLQSLEDEKILTAASDDVLIEQQESLLAGYLGHDLSDDERKVMHFKQLKLLKLQVQKLSKDNQILEGTVTFFEEEQKGLWYQLFGTGPDFFKLSDVSGDINKNILRIRNKTVNLQTLIYTYEKELSTLRGGNALIGPKAQDLIATLDKQMRTFLTQLSGIDQRAEMLENKGWLLDKAINLKQSALGSMVTKTREATDDIFEKALYILKYPLVSYSGMTLSLLLLLQVIILLGFAIMINRLYVYVVLRMGNRRNWSEQTVHLVQAVGKYPFIFIVTLILLSLVGINTRSLALVAGALSVGIGFGMQTIASNLVSGIILLFDKSIRPGDFISLGDNPQTGGFRGSVVQMNTRATVLRTNDNINIIIPNADLIASKVVNWTYGDDKIRFKVPFSVAYGTDIEKVKKVVREAMLDIPVILPHPEPQIWLTEHGESSLAFLAAIWVEGQNARQPARTSDTVLTAIYRTLHEHNIEIPFPQLDLRLRSNDHQSIDITTITDAIRHKMDKEAMDT